MSSSDSDVSEPPPRRLKLERTPNYRAIQSSAYKDKKTLLTDQLRKHLKSLQNHASMLGKDITKVWELYMERAGEIQKLVITQTKIVSILKIKGSQEELRKAEEKLQKYIIEQNNIGSNLEKFSVDRLSKITTVLFALKARGGAVDDLLKKAQKWFKKITLGKQIMEQCEKESKTIDIERYANILFVNDSSMKKIKHFRAPKKRPTKPNKQIKIKKKSKKKLLKNKKKLTKKQDTK